MKEIKFTTNYEIPLSFLDKNFKIKYEEKIGNNENYTKEIDGDIKHLALCPRCDNPVAILGIYKKIKTSPHARHIIDTDIPNIVQFNRYRYEHCPYHRRKANYVKEYVPETEEPQRRELYRAAREHFDKAIYLIQKKTGIHINMEMARMLAENYAKLRVYNYIDATIYNIPWYILYSFHGFPLYHMVVRKHSTLHKHLTALGIRTCESKLKGHVYLADNMGYLLRATNYRYIVDKDDNLKEWLDFSILCPDKTITDTLLYTSVDRFSISVDSSYFVNLMQYEGWKKQEELLGIAGECMEPC